MGPLRAHGKAWGERERIWGAGSSRRLCGKDNPHADCWWYHGQGLVLPGTVPEPLGCAWQRQADKDTLSWELPGVLSLGWGAGSAGARWQSLCPRLGMDDRRGLLVICLHPEGDCKAGGRKMCQAAERRGSKRGFSEEVCGSLQGSK